MPNTILVIDDRPAQLRLTESCLRQKLGYNALSASNHDEAIRSIIYDNPPQTDLVLIDFESSQQDTLQCIRQIKVHKPQLPVIVLTRYGYERLASMAIRAGADDFVTTPVIMERLGLSIENALKMKQLNNEIARLRNAEKQQQAAIAGKPSENTPAPPAVPNFLDMPSFLDMNGQLKKLRAIEEEAIRFAVYHCDGCMTRTARSLGIGRSTLYRKLDEMRVAANHISRATQTTRPMMLASSSNCS